MRIASVLALTCISGCSLFGPPLPPAVPSPEIVEFEAAPGRARAALLECARQYGATNGRAAAAESVADAAIYACRAELDSYSAIALQRAKGGARVLGLIDRSEARAEEAIESAKADARSAALDAAIRSKS